MSLLHTVYLAYGTNVGNRESNIKRAYELTEQKVGRIAKQSSLYETKPWGFNSENLFINSVVKVETKLTPQQLLKATQEIERSMGRTTKSSNGVYHDRIIDIDILLYDDICLNDPDLVIPHPLMRERDFVMIPLNEIIQ